ncbi:putative inner membrane transport protein yfav protein [Eutypa lata UCREL1]|uniref:Putative inner membrane transport protein yfav protein n=1 Tax=Eutypa lata (strain UCR-EL1) TaxID=1287681 RepID=M7SYN8_EUTLA|nr:putative inner membrane transport protein yfav protein [Eutypa lata UCREL1]
MDEKANSSTELPSALSTDAPSVDQEQGWTTEEELKARRKVDSTVLPLLFLGLLVFQLDRMNLASALTGGFATDIGVNQNTINLGNQLMFLGIVVLEIPSNLLLQKLGPRKWISAQVLVFGLIASLQVFIRDRPGFLATRMLLGLSEAGYIPGSVYTLQAWYGRGELARRVAVFFFGMFGGNAVSPLLASGILKLDGSRDHGKNAGGVHGNPIPFRIVWKTITHYKRWPHFVSTFAVFSTWSPLTTYTPSIIMSLGFDRISANALAAVGALLALGTVFGFAWLSDRTNRRGASVAAAHLCYLIALVVARSVHPHVGKWSRWGLWTAVNALAVGYHPVHNSWVQLNCRDAGERSIAIAMWVMSAISGLMVGTQYFRGDDAPFYDTGLRTMIIMVAVGMFFALLQIAIYTIHNRRVAQGKITHRSRGRDRRDGDGSREEEEEEAPMIYVP